jgi:hypothetical protein
MRWAEVERANALVRNRKIGLMTIGILTIER